MFVQLANRFDAKIEVVKGEIVVDGKSVASMLGLGAACGAELCIRARGNDADQAVEKLSDLVASSFGE